MTPLLRLALPGLLLHLCACGGSSGPGTHAEPTPPHLTISPATAPTLAQGASFAFTAQAVPVVPASRILWRVVEPEGGTVDPTGVYRAPADATGPFHVEAALDTDREHPAMASVEVLPRDTPANALVAVDPPDDPSRWRLLSVDAYPPGYGVVATRSRKLFVLRGPENLRIRGHALDLSGSLRGLQVDLSNLLETGLWQLNGATPLVLAAWPYPAPPSPYAFSYGAYVLGSAPLLDTEGASIAGLDAGQDQLFFALELPAGQTFLTLGQTLDMAGSRVGYLDEQGVLRTAPLSAGTLRGAVQ